jgi:hypothetical protein
MADEFHYPPDLFELLVETIPRLSRAKKSVILFFRGAGVPNVDLTEVERIIDTAPKTINKFEITRTLLEKINARGDSGLRVRREIIKRVVEFESFETCWPEDQLKAKGLVASVREAVNAKDSFTRMKQERDNEKEILREKATQERNTALQKQSQLDDVYTRLSSLFNMNNQPQERGKLLEVVLNDLFKIYGIHIREDFRRKAPDSALVLEQIDGVIDLNGTIFLVEMKWLKDPIGIAEFSPHLVRLFGRANASGIFISNSGFTEPVLKECAAALNQRTMFLCSLKEIVFLLQRQADLPELLKRKSQAAIVEKNPYLEILS